MRLSKSRKPKKVAPRESSKEKTDEYRYLVTNGGARPPSPICKIVPGDTRNLWAQRWLRLKEHEWKSSTKSNREQIERTVMDWISHFPKEEHQGLFGHFYGGIKK